MSELPIGVLDGKPNAFDTRNLFDLYYTRLCYFAHKLIGNKEASEDIVQDAFVAYWKKSADFDNELSIKSFLYLTVKNACLNVIRHEQVVKRFAESNEDSGYTEEKITENIIRSEVAGEIHSAIATLPKGCRQVLELAYFGELKNDEIAEQLQISINTVKTQKARALQLLRLKLDVGTLILVLAATGF
ncbi:MAG TPA: RNA polymerase sigma-70 factor [Chitinophagaceae bacterium]|nr:RNA polymerase sigma-70 factor [Chitinophagaceae bacterium]